MAAQEGAIRTRASGARQRDELRGACGLRVRCEGQQCADEQSPQEEQRQERSLRSHTSLSVTGITRVLSFDSGRVMRRTTGKMRAEVFKLLFLLVFLRVLYMGTAETVSISDIGFRAAAMRLPRCVTSVTKTYCPRRSPRIIAA